MSVQTSLSIFGGNYPYNLVVEPWANQYRILPNDKCLLVAIHPTKQTDLSLELHDQNDLIIYIERAGCTYEFYRNGLLET